MQFLHLTTGWHRNTKRHIGESLLMRTVTVPGVCSQPVGRPILLPPTEDLDGMTAQHVTFQMLVHT
ncbi:hypothetical protein EYF80_007211 [Liparis tanakae]|uniref:Uncharacterized protein n=1 Tax=Liparis tanakae TaxID=230148 RepID=A0A4Z2IZT1_9TELE|nr:hypothetical protein EYF80_007211 [Liparis tanakae]